MNENYKNYIIEILQTIKKELRMEQENYKYVDKFDANKSGIIHGLDVAADLVDRYITLIKFRLEKGEQWHDRN